MKPFVLEIQSEIQEGGIRRRQRARAFLLLLQLLEQHGQNETARVVIRAVAFREVWHREHGVLEESGRIGHARQMIELELREVPRRLVQSFRRKSLAG